ncbi:hypothetical protein N5D61_19995 [Pseudomonas sp. GD03842]|uniref:hypothetical protein n=1 Tax=Pseudomonas sp. GD03842 TaxID=2975385 RepID=UPI00244C6DA6|nr:hypothetical protein [Pseudomonas sp. GD03842]MDH0748610.1 hypothetical protein [Pseudomonas sp. GD03842]
MTQKIYLTSVEANRPLELAEAIEAYVAQGGVINIVPEGETRHASKDPKETTSQISTTAQPDARLEQLKGLVAKGAGVTALQYSLRMNRKDIKRLASENGVKIHHSRPVRGARLPRSRDPVTIDDVTAGHAMHYSTLGYTVQEIAQLLDIGVRDVWNIGKAYRFELSSATASDTGDIEAASPTQEDDREERNT